MAPEILAIIPPGATRIYAGKASGRHHLPQDEINALLLKLARAGRSVVRLKGGDPFIFGRGSEEVEFLAQAGMRFEIVPGISAASGCASYLGIPLTHRGLASGVRFVTGHARDDRELDLDWQGLADIDTTLVIYMGLGQLAEISQRLIAAGLPASTPAAAIERGTTAAQRRTVTTLDELPAAAAGLQPPTLIVIGRVVSLAGALDWFEADSGTEESGDVAARA